MGDSFLIAQPAAASFEDLNERDRVLMARIAQGDLEAYADLFDRQAPVVLGVLVRLLRQRSLAEEVLQETFLQAWMQARDYRPELGSPRGWLLLIARSRALDCLRREGSRGRREERVALAEPHVLPATGTARLETLELCARVREGLQRLPPAQQACLALAYWEDLSHPEIARRLEMPLGSVKSRVRLGMRKLGGLLAIPAHELQSTES
jgi:RNA polymerase sigma-70 factor (ECF subfamily)